MPIVQIHLVEGRSPEMLDRLQREVTDAIANSIGAPKDTIRIILSEMKPEHHSIGGMTIAELRKK